MYSLEEALKVYKSHQLSLHYLRNKEDDNDFEKHQDLYDKMAIHGYDKTHALEEYHAPKETAKVMNDLFHDKKDVRILDYGCGTGLVGDELIKFGFRNIDGSDPNKEMLEIARKKNVMQNLFQLRSDESHDVIYPGTYDGLCSAGVFFVTRSHPGFECVKELCKLVKKDGYVVIVTGNVYFNSDYVDYGIVDDLEKEGIIKIISKRIFQGYRKKREHEEDGASCGVCFTFQRL